MSRRKLQTANCNAKSANQKALCAAAMAIALGILGTPARSQNLTATPVDRGNQFDSNLRAGDQARSTGDLASAEASYRQATIINPRSLDAWLRLGVVQLRSNELDAAAQSYRAAQVIDATNLDASFALGQIALRLGNPRAAAEELEFGLKSHPADSQLNYAAGIAYALERKFDIALEHYRRAFAYDPQNVLIGTDYGLLQLQTGDAEGARETLESIAKSSQATDRTRLVLALSYIALGKSNDALLAAPSFTESALRQLLSENYPRTPPDRESGEQQLVFQNQASDVPAAERSAIPEHQPAEVKNSKTAMATSSGAGAASTYPKNGISAMPRNSATDQEKAATRGDYRLQLASERSEERAREDWKRLREQNSNVFGDVSLTIVRAELGQKGTFYRVQVGPVGDLKEAQKRCAQLKVRQIDCFVATPK